MDSAGSWSNDVDSEVGGQGRGLIPLTEMDTRMSGSLLLSELPPSVLHQGVVWKPGAEQRVWLQGMACLAGSWRASASL